MKKYSIHYYDEDYEEKTVETNLDGFFKELFELYEKYNISISHEDGHGGFILEKNSKGNREWIEEAGICPFLNIEDAYSLLYDGG